MKASLKFRDEQKPLFRAKVPLSILGIPFQSGIVAGDSKELTLNLGTSFESGPAVKFAYRPNDAWNPFSLAIKIGTGAYGSPFSGPLLMTADFNLLGRGNNPSFMLHFKPRFGDFSIKKSQSSVFDKKGSRTQNGVVVEDDSSVEVVDAPAVCAGFAGVNGIFAGRKFTVMPSEFPDASSISGVFSGMQMSATTALPVKGRTVVNFRWGVRVPAEGKVGGVNSTAEFSLQKIPFLVMNKIGIEHVDGHDPKRIAKVGQDLNGLGNPDVVEACLSVKRNLEFLQAENGLLRKAVEDLRYEIAGGKSRFPAGDKNPGIYREMKSYDWRSNDKGKSTEGDMNEKLKKATGA